MCKMEQIFLKCIKIAQREDCMDEINKLVGKTKK